MSIIRAMIAVLISVGLVLSPVAVGASPMSSPEAGLSHSHAMLDSSGVEELAAIASPACCDQAGMMEGCMFAPCAFKCCKVATTVVVSVDYPTRSPSPVTPSTAPEAASAGWRPPVPPPRA